MLPVVGRREQATSRRAVALTGGKIVLVDCALPRWWHPLRCLWRPLSLRSNGSHLICGARKSPNSCRDALHADGASAPILAASIRQWCDAMC